MIYDLAIYIVCTQIRLLQRFDDFMRSNRCRNSAIHCSTTYYWTVQFVLVRPSVTPIIVTISKKKKKIRSQRTSKRAFGFSRE